MCCRDGHYRGHKSCNVPEKTQPHQKISRKMNGTCISRMYVDVHEARHVTVRYIPTHTGHKPDCIELKFLPLPESTKEEVALSGNSNQEDIARYIHTEQHEIIH